MRSVSTQEFLETLFGNEVDNIVYGSYKDGVKPTRYKLWGNRKTDLNLDNTNYYTISVFDNDPAKPTANRRTQIFRSLHVVVLDDIGEKYDPPKGWPEPTYIMQTSVKGGIVNQQWGYKLRDPIINAKTASDFLKTVVNGSGASDKVGDIGRLVRMPGTNHKPECDDDGGNVCKLLTYHPDREFTVDQMLEWVNTSRGEMDFCKMPTSERGPCDDPSGHPMVDAFEEAGLLINAEPNARGWFDVECPWIDKHSCENVEETALIVRNDGSWLLHCYHSSCKPFGQDRFDSDDVCAELKDRGAKVPTDKDCSDWALEQSTPVESDDNNVGASLLERYVLISSLDKWFDTEKQYLLKGTALDTKYAWQFRSPYLSRILGEHQARREADGVGFMPYNPNNIDGSVFQYGGLNYANSYRPPHIKPREGEPREWLDLVGYVYGRHTELFLDHLAFTCQYPEIKIRWQVLLYGAPRTGKSMSIQPILRIFGSHGKEVNMKNTRSKYDDMYIGAKVVAFEEVHKNRGADEFYNDLKNTATSDNFESLEQKGTSFVTQANRYSMYLFSNHRDALPLDKGGNKFLVVEGPNEPKDPEFYHKVGACLYEQEYLGMIYNYLLERDVSKFDAEILPIVTREYKQMVEFSKSPEELVVRECMDESKLPFVTYQPSEKRPAPRGKFKYMEDLIITRQPEIRAFCSSQDLSHKQVSSAIAALGFKYSRPQSFSLGAAQRVQYNAPPGFELTFERLVLFKVACGMLDSGFDNFIKSERKYIDENNISQKSLFEEMRDEERKDRLENISLVDD